MITVDEIMTTKLSRCQRQRLSPTRFASWRGNPFATSL